MYAYQLPAQFLPPQLLRNLSPAATASLTIIHALCLNQKRKAKRGGCYAVPSQRWLASRTCYSIRQISRAIAELKAQGLLTVIHRRKRHGYFQTCLYKLGSRLKAFFCATVKRLFSSPHHTPETADIVLINNINNIAKEAPQDQEPRFAYKDYAKWTRRLMEVVS